MNNLLRQLKIGGSTIVLIAAASSAFTAANAQGSSDNSAAPETVTVTGSRISIQGYEAPTPVTVIDAATLQRDAEVNIADSLTQLPSVGQSSTPSNGTNSGHFSQGDVALSVINLRNLGISRTLVLFDGQRVVSSNLIGGGVDLSTIPTELVSRVDVVTGGASAAYGSDAVAGVVNLILNKNFTGFKASLEGSDNTSEEHRQAKAAATWGTTFDGDRGHLILSADYTTSPDTVLNLDMRRYTNQAIVQNPAATSTNGLPYYIHVVNAGDASHSQGGLITGNTAGGVGGTVTANGLLGTQFVGAGIPTPFNFGTLNAANPAVCYNGCSGNAANNPGALGITGEPYHNSTFFAYTSYQVTPDIKASVQLNYGLLAEENDGGNRTTVASIAADNAYLPTSIASQFGTLSNGYNTTTGLGGSAVRPTQTLTLGTNNLNNIDLTQKPNLRQICATAGVPCLYLNRALERGVATLEGDLGDDWSWNVYAQHSGVRERQVAAQDSFTSRYNNAIDAVKVTATNVGTSGLPIGSIQCRALLSAATAAAAAGCQPLDIFGTNVASQASILYINPGQQAGSGILNQELITLNQDVFSGSMQGVLPWSLPAGKVAVAFGAEYRHEQGGIPFADPNGSPNPAINPAGPQYSAGNFAAYKGQYNVEEGFVEVDAPLLKDQVVQNLNLNLAGRMTDYSTSGLVETWKVGLTSQIDNNIKLRGTWSLDIRAPLVSDLFSPGIAAVAQIQYPLGTASYNGTNVQGGNSNLQPEKAFTESVGVVLTPEFLDGFSASVDLYNINIHDGIFTSTFQTIVNRCVQGETIYCPQLIFSPSFMGGTKPATIDTFPLNAAEQRTSGLDVQANYTTALYDGRLDLAALGNYVDELTQTAIGVTYDSAGSLGGPLAYASSGEPKFHGTLSATYTQGPWSGTIQGRFIGAAVLTDGTENLPANITRASLSPAGVLTAGVGNGNLLDNNNVNPVGYLDLRASYKWNDAISVFGAIDNLTNVPRPADGSAQTYDNLGRDIRVGVRFSD